MISASDWAMIRSEIARAVSVLIYGQTATTNDDDVVGTESIDKCPPGNPTIKGRPVMHPYGLVSRAVAETVSIVARIGDHPGNRLVVGHRDKNRPTLGAAGEVMLYDAFGNRVHLKDGVIVVKLDDKLELGEGATKQAARKADTVRVTIPAGSLALAVSGGSATGPAVPLDVTGEITSGSAKVTITD